MGRELQGGQDDNLVKEGQCNWVWGVVVGLADGSNCCKCREKTTTPYSGHPKTNRLLV